MKDKMDDIKDEFEIISKEKGSENRISFEDVDGEWRFYFLLLFIWLHERNIYSKEPSPKELFLPQINSFHR